MEYDFLEQDEIHIPLEEIVKKLKLQLPYLPTPKLYSWTEQVNKVFKMLLAFIHTLQIANK